MPFDGETEDRIEELVDELYAALVDDRDLRFWEGGIVSVAPTGAPPEFITIEIEGFDDQSVMWRGVPASLSVGDEVVVWENPITHRREILGGSGIGGTSTSSPWQKITVAVIGGDFTLLSAAIVWINALPGPVAPSATQQFAINLLGGTFVEAADVTVPAWVSVDGEGETSVVDMGDFRLDFAGDSSGSHFVVTGTADDSGILLNVAGSRVVLSHVRSVLKDDGCAVYFTVGISDVELYHVVCEAGSGPSRGFWAYGATSVLLWDCKADDSTNFAIALDLDDTAAGGTVTTKFCEFGSSAADVVVDTTYTWEHFCCNFDPSTVTMNGTEVPLTHGLTNFADGIEFTGATGVNIVTVPGALAVGFTLVDDAAVEYLRLKTVAQLETHFNVGLADIDHIVGASVADAFVVRGSDSQITLGILGAGLIETTAGGVLSSDYTINSTVTMASGQDIDPTDASGQDLGDATHRWDLYTQDVIFGGASGANIITVLDNVADALHIVDDTTGDEYLRIVTTNANPYFLIDPAAAGILTGIGTPTPGTSLELHTPAGSNPALRLTDGDVAHPFQVLIPITTADTIAQIGGVASLAGGLGLSGFTDADVNAAVLQGHLGVGAPTKAGVVLQAYKTDGAAGRIPLAATEKVLQVRNGLGLITTIQGNGHIGIMTPTPAYELHAYDAAADAYLKVESDGADAGLMMDCVAAGGDCRVYWQEAGANRWGLHYYSGANYLRLYNYVAGTTTAYLYDAGDISFCSGIGDFGIGAITPATLLELERVEALAGALADGYAACLTLDPGYDTGAHAVTRHNYIDVQNPSVADGASVTAAAVMRFDAAIGTHKCLPAAFQTTDSGADTTNWAGGLLININGTLHKIPYIAA